MDRLLLEDMSFYGYHGDLPAERDLGARYRVSLSIGADLAEAGSSDSLEGAVDYVHVFKLVREVVEGQPHRLLESLAQTIAGRILELPRVEEVTVRVGKTPPVPGAFREFAVEITRPRRA